MGHLFTLGVVVLKERASVGGGWICTVKWVGGHGAAGRMIRMGYSKLMISFISPQNHSSRFIQNHRTDNNKIYPIRIILQS